MQARPRKQQKLKPKKRRRRRRSESMGGVGWIQILWVLKIGSLRFSTLAFSFDRGGHWFFPYPALGRSAQRRFGRANMQGQAYLKRSKRSLNKAGNKHAFQESGPKGWMRKIVEVGHSVFPLTFQKSCWLGADLTWRMIHFPDHA